MNVVGINGSGRLNGNTAVLVRAILEGAAEAGAKTHLIQLAGLKIAGCDSSRLCKPTRRCLIKDDMKRFYDLAPEADVLVLTSPIYLDHITGQMMSFFQRTYCYLGLGLENYWPRKNVRAVLGLTYNADEPDRYDFVLDWFTSRLEFYYQIPTIERFKVSGTQRDVFITRDHPEVQRAYEFGKTLHD
jgi:multimeric flavodoxin WrbA